MEKDKIDQLFEHHQGNFDVAQPNPGHEARFLAKLDPKDSTLTETKQPPKLFNLWKPLIAVAATVVICIGLMTVINPRNETKDLAQVSPELSKTQDFFTSTIETELNKLSKVRSPQTKTLIDDAMAQLKVLEADYESLKNDLTESGDDKRVIYAMISNFQNRIDVLQNVMERIEELKNIKQLTL